MAEAKEYNYCLRCGRKLKSKQSRLRGFGDNCYKKSVISDSNVKPLVEIGGKNMVGVFSDAMRKDYLIRLNQLRILVTANDSEYRFGKISHEEYNRVCMEINNKLDVLEHEIMGGR